MNKKIWQLLKREKGLVENVFSLAMLQFFNIVIPILLIPVLYTRLGVELFAMIMVSQALSAYFVIITDYGFNLSATRHISINRDVDSRVSEAFSSVLILKIALCSISFIIYYTIVVNYSNYSNYKELFLLSYLSVIGQTLFPSWFFQGVEKMKYITLINSLIKIFCSVLIYFIIQSDNDFIYYPIIFGIGAIGGAIWAIVLAFKNYNLKFYFPEFSVVYSFLKESTGFFFSRIAVTSYTTLNIIVLSFFASPTIVGHYSIAEKIYMAIRSVYQPVSTALYPYISKNRNLNVFRRIFHWLTIINILGVALLYILSPWIIKVATGSFQNDSIEYLRLFSLLILIIMPSIFLGYPLLGALGYSHIVNKSVIIPSIVHITLILLFSLVGLISSHTIIYVLFSTEVFVLVIRYVYVRKYHLYSFK